MNDIENVIIDKLSKVICAKYPKASVKGELVRTPVQFPCVSILQTDNVTAMNYLDSSDKEPYSRVIFQIEIFSNKKTGKKTECKDIANIIDNTLFQLGFVRALMQPLPNMADATIYRITMRYSAIVSSDNKIYRR